jgi:branched-chain amino acid transport system permease protein
VTAYGAAAALGYYWVLQRFWPAPAGVLLQGVVVGGLTALIAFGIALVYRANRIVSFAQGDLGGLPAALAVLLILGPGVPYVVALPIAIVAAIALGSLVEVLLIRRFFRAPRLILTVVTIGIAQLLAALTTLLPRLFDLNRPAESFPSPIDVQFSIGQTVFRGNEVLALLAVPVVIAALSWFLYRTNTGVAIRACAESSERAALLGVPVRRVQNIVWIVAAVLATLGVFLRAGVLGLPLGSVLGPTILIRALAAAVIGRMVNLPTIFVASIGLGVLESSVLYSTSRAFLVDPILFLVIVAALLLQRRGASPRTDEASSWQATREIRPVPGELRALPEVRWATRGVTAAVIAALVLLPTVLSEAQLNLAAVIAIIAIVGTSLVVLTGWAGQVSLGQIGLMGIGAAVAGHITTAWGWDLLVTVFAAGFVGALVAVVIGLPALRIRGLFLAVVTLAFALATSSYLLNREFVHWLPAGRVDRSALLGRIGVNSEARYYYFTLAALAFALLLVRGLRRSRTGRALLGVRENERGAQAYGINAVRAKLTAFAVSGFLAAFAGALFVHHQQSLGIQPYGPERSFQVFVMVVIGGLGSPAGAVLGPLFVEGLQYFRGSFPEAIRPVLGFLSTGVGLILVLLLVPGGLGQVVYGARDRYLRWVAARRGIHVPSLTADRQVDTDVTAPAAFEHVLARQ